ncbi:MAG: serine/threonine-protein phosphatase [Planctomycetes bacterium]|nr:serine/threonine-protein phosphatase [Planctomycetota bacterium]
MRWEQQVQYASISDIGFRRQNNQDSLSVQICNDQETWGSHGHLFLVADGMGGHAVGELASKMAVDTIPHTFFKTRDQDVTTALQNAFEVANGVIYKRGSLNRDFERMGTTCVSLVLSPEGAVIGHVGDSRVYRIRDARIDQLTFDHSLQWELIRQGRMSPENVFLHEPRHVITRSLGPEETTKVDIEGPYPILPGDIYLLCSDGLTNHVNDSEIGMIAGELSVGDACRLLVNLANLRGGSDNISVVIVKVGDVPGGFSSLEDSQQPAVQSGINFWWLTGFWAVAITFVGGISLSLLDRVPTGMTLMVISCMAFVTMMIRYWKTRRRRSSNDPSSAETTLWSPYRTASAKFTQTFLSHLAAVESELQQTADEEGWSIDRTLHETYYRKAKQALVDGEYSLAFEGLARSIDVLMAGVHLQRKQSRQEHQREKSSAPPRSVKEEEQVGGETSEFQVEQ